jgi:hypothetical protein
MTNKQSLDSRPYRRFRRIPFIVDAELKIQTHTFKTEVIDLCLKGILIKKPLQFSYRQAQNIHGTLHFRLTDSLIRLQMVIRIVHQHQGYLGLSIEHIDLESISHVKRLVELNMGDQDLLFRELHELIVLPNQHHSFRST